MKMANIALIIAGGVGARMGQDIPKQFINVNDRPVIIYTLEAFQKHPEIDAIEVVCLDGWHDVLKAYAKQFGIAKLENIVSGGLNGQDSIRNGLLDIYKRYNSDDDVVLQIILKFAENMAMQLLLYLVQQLCLKHIILFQQKNKLLEII